MRVDPVDIAHISPVDAAVLMDVGWLAQWPWEVSPAAAQVWRREGYWRLVIRARETLVASPGLGQLRDFPVP